MGKNKDFSGPRAERKAGHDLFMQRLNERNRLEKQAEATFKNIDVRPMLSFMLAADPEEAADRTMIKPQVLKNLSLGRFDPSANQRQQIVRAAGEMGYEAPAVK